MGPYAADFIQYDPFANLSVSNPQDCHNHPELKRKVYAAYSEGDEGELSIAIPRDVSLKSFGISSHNGVASECAYLHYHILDTGDAYTSPIDGTPEPQTRASSLAPTATTEFAPLVVHVEYSLRNPVDGVEFVMPTDAYPYVSIEPFRSEENSLTRD